MMNLYKLYYSLERLYTAVSRRLPGGFAFPPLQVVFELTYRCNLKCDFCYQRRQVDQLGVRSHDRAGELSAKEIKRVIRQTPLWSLIVFSGGEPLLRKDALDIIQYAARKRRCHLVTNGTYISSEVAEAIVDAKVMSVGISLDGDQKIHDMIRGIEGTYDRVCRAIEHLQHFREKSTNRWPMLNIKTTISQANVAHLREIVALAQEMQVDFCTFQMLNNSINISGLRTSRDFVPYGTRPDPIEDFDIATLERELRILNQPRKKPTVRFIPDLSIGDYISHYDNRLALSEYECRTPWATLNISPYGDVFPCLNYLVGNVRTEGLAHLWNNDKYRVFRRTLKTGLFPNCIGCCDLQRRHTFRNHS